VWKGEVEVILKISDQGGGIHPSKKRDVWKYGYTTVPRSLDEATIVVGGDDEEAGIYGLNTDKNMDASAERRRNPNLVSSEQKGSSDPFLPSFRKSVFKRTVSTSEMVGADSNLNLNEKTKRSLPRTRKVAGYGFGLPLSKLYARYFGGNIHFQSMYGYGTDVYVHLNHLGNVKEGLNWSSVEEVF